MSRFPATTVLGYPRIGPRRELKRALESYWDGALSRDELLTVGAALRAGTWARLADLGLEGLPSSTFSLYDHVLDAAVLIGAVPDRFRADDPLDSYFAMARGADHVAPLRMTKWFNTNYHYIVPELDGALGLDARQPLNEVREAKRLGYTTRPVLVGPVTLLLLSRGGRLDRLDELVDVYCGLLGALAAEGVEWVQLDEPAFVQDRSRSELDALARAYQRIGRRTDRPQLLVASYFGDLGAALPVLAEAPIEAIALDLVAGDPHDVPGKVVVAGVVSGRNVWRTDPADALARLAAVTAGEVTVSSSCSLLHVPYDLELETDLPDALRGRLAFAEQKVAEIVALAGRPATGVVRRSAPSFAVAPAKRRAPYPVRAAAQRLGLPLLPVTTTGSFPQTGELRAARTAVGNGTLAEDAYETRVLAEIERVIRLQERLGLDVLVHGEPERNDMVQYFAEHLDGFAVTRFGWVQSYGSRCTRPPLLYADVVRREPITVRWSRYAQSLTDKPVKGMLTGPVTIVAWSFVREDVPLAVVTRQVADAIRAEVDDLQAAGLRVIQVDEPALRELMPLRSEAAAAYLEWAVEAYRHATSSAAASTQIHTHLCYCDATQILAAIDGLDADVTSIESARSGGHGFAFARGLGPGVYDIHSPRIPSVDEVVGSLRAALDQVPPERLWVNPDCGLKTRTYAQVEAALSNVVSATALVRSALGSAPDPARRGGERP
jgi:5-methyltetrahydropteroyltriglutamate--homocysteine methyltransferase